MQILVNYNSLMMNSFVFNFSLFFCSIIQYFLVVLMLLLIEFGVCLMITLWPQCLGLNLDETIMVKVLQGGYGVPGKEQVRLL